MDFIYERGWGPPLTVATLRELLAGYDGDMLVVTTGLDGAGFACVHHEYDHVRTETVVSASGANGVADFWSPTRPDAHQGEPLEVLAIGE